MSRGQYSFAMTTPLPELLAKVATLNDPANPFTYEVDGDKIVGKWDIVRAQSLYPTEFSTIDKKFSVIITLNEGKGTWKPRETDSESGLQVDGDGISLGGSVGSFSGKRTQKSFSFEFGGINNTKDGLSPVLAWSFDSDKIKKPLFAFLEENGWKRKKGLFG